MGILGNEIYHLKRCVTMIFVILLSCVWLPKVPDFEFVSGIHSHIFPI